MPNQCPQCGAALPGGALAGLCPACLLRQGAETGPPPESLPFQPPGLEEVARLFPQLQILAFLGKGGMGAVYKARQPALDRLVALKILPPQAAAGPGFAERFNREARALARLNHPNIVAVHEFGQAGASPFFIMEFVDGLTLRQLEQAARLSPDEALRIVPQICEALQYAHDEGIVHRDIKPENILIDKKGRVKIADFGIAKIIAPQPGRADLPVSPEIGAAQQPGPTGIVGTPHYMAPEQVETPQKVDHRADIFSLGVVFYEMLTGQLPLGRFAPPSRKVQIDARLDEVVLRALESEPDLRYQHAAEVKTEIDTITSSPPGASPSGENTRPRVSQSAPPPAGFFQSAGKILDWLPPVFFIMGLSMAVVATVIDTENDATIACILLFFTLALILGMWRWPVVVKWIVGLLMVGLYEYGHIKALDIERLDAAMDHAHGEIAFNYKAFYVESLVLLSAAGVIASAVMRWLSEGRDKDRTEASPSAAPPRENRRIFGWVALGFFVVGSLGWPLLIALHADENAAAAFGVVALALAVIFGLISWRERPGYKISMAILGVVALAGIIVVPLGLYGVFTLRHSTTRPLSYGASRERTNFGSGTNFAPSIFTMTAAQPNIFRSTNTIGTNATGDFVEYAVNKTWPELGDAFDLSTPEKAVASFGIRTTGETDLATLMNKATIGAARLPEGLLKVTVSAQDVADMLRNTVVEVVLYRDDLAGVITFRPSTNQFITECVELQNGEWKIYANDQLDFTLTKEAAVKQFEREAWNLREKIHALTANPTPDLTSPAGEVSNGIVQIVGAFGQAMQQRQGNLVVQPAQQVLSNMLNLPVEQMLSAARAGNSGGSGSFSIGPSPLGPATTYRWTKNGTNFTVTTNQ